VGLAVEFAVEFERRVSAEHESIDR
jgi:hypothetical protein